MKKLAIKSTLSAAAVAVSLGLMANAKAEQLDETFVNGASVPTATVSFSRAELASDEGRAAVELRVHMAAERVCGSQSYREAGGLSRYSDRKACYDQAISQAMSQMGSDQVASVNN